MGDDLNRDELEPEITISPDLLGEFRLRPETLRVIEKALDLSRF